MNYKLYQALQLKQDDCLVLGFCSDTHFGNQLTDCPQDFITHVTHLSETLKDSGDWLCDTAFQSTRLLLVHCGKQAKFDTESLLKTLAIITPLLLQQKIKTVQIALPTIQNQSADSQLQLLLLTLDGQCYTFNDYKTLHKTEFSLKTIHFSCPGAHQEALDIAQATAEGVRYTRWLSDLPANHCTPSILAKEAEQLGKQYPAIQVQVLGREEIQQLGMGALLAVSQGSVEPPRFIELNYRGDTKHPPIVLVGKGVTFDAGGISLKPPPSMEEMKYDMAGAASVLGTLKVCAKLKLPIHVVGLIPSTENLPSGSAIKPGDVITGMSGQTIEIVNTDAEGRLILSDALTYAERYKPEFVLDMATLTGAMIIALGHITSGFMTPDDELADLITKASQESHDKAWRLPLDAAYQEGLESPVADMLNSTADRSAGSITAACFLARFTQKYRWAHLDIAGTAWVSGRKRQATGRPVPLLVEILRHVIKTR